MGIGSCRLLCLLHAANSSFTSFVYTLMQSSTPISPFHKGDKSFLWKRQPKSSSVYAELKRFGFYANEFCFDFFFLISLFKRQCNICSVCSSCLDHGWLLLLPHVQLPSSWCVGQCCAQTLTPLKPWLGVEGLLLMPGGAAGPWVSSPPDVHQHHQALL